LSRSGWTLLVQGVDQQVEAVHQLMQQFRFAPDARLDDVMISYASDGGGVGPHFDSYDVFLLQVSGRRRWRIGPQKKKQALREGVPLKILATFEPEEEWILEPGDMLYLPPRYAHDGVAVGGDCMTYSIGFRAPRSDELARELLTRLADEASDEVGDAMYRDGTQPAVEQPAAIPAALPAFAQAALQKALSNPALLGCLLGEWLTEPKASVWFDAGEVPAALGAIRLDRRTRMMYDDEHVYINGEAFAAEGPDADLMHQLANRRELDAAGVRRCTAGARQLLLDWVSAGWVQPAR
jgi:50S ribosomal protein L16 3-hydroxylase